MLSAAILPNQAPHGGLSSQRAPRWLQHGGQRSHPGHAARRRQQAEEGLIPLCSVAASKSGEASPWHRWTLGNPMVQMDADQSYGADGCGASLWQGRTRGKPTAQVDMRHPHGTDGHGAPPRHRQTQGVPMAQLDVGHPPGHHHDMDGCRASPRRKQMWGILTVGMDA